MKSLLMTGGRKTLIFILSVFLFFLLFYTFFHPAILTTPDDWLYVSYTRNAIPILPKHNPTRVLPEILMPLVSNISTQLLMPLGVGFEMAIASGLALVLSLTIVFYTLTFIYVVRKKIVLSERATLWITAFFLLFHFLAFRTRIVDNPYLLGSFCLTNYYFYTLPILMNASLVMYCMGSDILDRLTKIEHWKFGLFITLVYLCFLSNLYSSILLIVYFFLVLVSKFRNSHFDIKSNIRENRFLWSMMLFYIIILIFEANGGNAKTLMGGNVSFLSGLRQALASFFGLRAAVNLVFVGLFVIVSSYTIYLYSSKHIVRIDLKEYGLYSIFGFILVSTFCILISSQSKPYYVAQSDKMLSEFFWLLFGLSMCMAYCVKHCSRFEAILPVLFLLLFCHTNTKNKTFCDVIHYDTMHRENVRLLSILDQANQANVDSLTLYVPKIEGKEDNWPYPLYFGMDLSNTFYNHRLTRKCLTINIEAIPGLVEISSSLSKTSALNYEKK